MAGIADDGAVLHFLEVLAGQNRLVPGDGDEDVSDLCGLRHGHHAETVHDGFDGPHGINLGDDYVGAQALGAHGHALAAPTVSCDHNAQPCNQQIGRADDAVNGGLAGAVAVVEEMLGLRIIYRNDGIFQRSIFRHRAQTDHAGGRLFGAADHAGNQVRVFCEQQRHKVRAIVHRNLACGRWRRIQMRVVSGAVFS